MVSSGSAVAEAEIGPKKQRLSSLGPEDAEVASWQKHA